MRRFIIAPTAADVGLFRSENAEVRVARDAAIACIDLLEGAAAAGLWTRRDTRVHVNPSRLAQESPAQPIIGALPLKFGNGSFASDGEDVRYAGV